MGLETPTAGTGASAPMVTIVNNVNKETKEKPRKENKDK